MTGIIWGGPQKIGDTVALVSHLPENYYKNTGNKLIDLDNIACLDHNPYVVRGQEPTEIWKIWGSSPAAQATQAATICNRFGLKCYRNRPRLYQYEQIKQSPLYSLYNSVVLHFRGESVGMVPINVQNYIINKYKERGWWTVQVGNQLDYYCGADFDRRDNTFWDTCRYVAESQEVVCVDSCVYHIAQAYDTRIKVILVNKTEEELLDFHPLMWDFGKNCGWVGANCEVYNTFDHDIGLTRSYLSI
jgi:hypothetical protein